MYRTILRLCQTRSPSMSLNKERARNVLSSPRELWVEALVEAYIFVFGT